MLPLETYVRKNGVWVPTRPGTPDPPPDPPTPHQVLGFGVGVSGGAWNGPSGNLPDEEARLAEMFGWDNGGPPVQRIFRQQQAPPWSEVPRIITAGRIPWMSLKPASGGVAADRAGSNDAHWIAWGNYLKQFWPNPIWFTYDHENDRHSHSGASNVSSPGWWAYQQDFREAFRRVIGLMRAADTTHGLEHVTFAMIWTGFAFQNSGNRDPGAAWHPDFDVFGLDPYDGWLHSDGTPRLTKRPLLSKGGMAATTGTREHYAWCTDPINYYATYRPTWDIPEIVADNLDKFPIRMAIAETGTCFDMKPNATNTLWIPQEDPDDPNNYQGAWMTQACLDLRTIIPRYEVVCYFHSGQTPIGEQGTNPYYFAGPAANRWGAEWPGSIAAWRAECLRPEHRLPITPWTPQGLA